MCTGKVKVFIYIQTVSQAKHVSVLQNTDYVDLNVCYMYARGNADINAIGVYSSL